MRIGLTSLNQTIGKIELRDRVDSHPYHRILVYEIIDHLNNISNKIMEQMKPGNNRDSLLDDIKRVKEIVNKV